MNILPHKSWHVRNKDNIERVRRDEEKARLEEEKRAKRAALADQEARTALLRGRAISSQLSSGTNTTGSELTATTNEPRHINFFKDIEDGLVSKQKFVEIPIHAHKEEEEEEKKKSEDSYNPSDMITNLHQGSNSEYEAEKKAEQEKQEKAIGLLTYLGQSVSEKHGDKPWYEKKTKPTGQEEDNNKFDSKRKASMDPLNSMKKYLATKETFDLHKEKKHSKDKKKKKKKEEKSPKKKSIEELRAERLKREGNERARERNLMSGSRGEKPKEIEDDPYRYNSQFNPDLVRKPRHTSHHRFKPY